MRRGNLSVMLGRLSGCVPVVLGMVVLAIFLTGVTPQVAAQPPQAPFQRGMNLAGWFQYFSDVSQIQFTRFSRQDFENIQSLGCDHIRLPIDMFALTGPGPDYAFDPLFFTLLDQIIDWTEDLNLHLILDNHTFDPSVDTSPDSIDQLLAVWTQMADRYKNRSDIIYYEVLNEPHGIADSTWNKMQQQVIDAIRAKDQVHTIIVGPAGWNGYHHLRSMPEYEDPNLIYTFHLYEPFLLTHQGATWIDPSMATVVGVPYPYDASRMPDIPAELQGTWIESDFDEYPTQGNDAWVQSQIDIAIQFMNDRQVPLWCGEFGVYMRNSHTDDRARWLETARTYFEANGIAWAMWEYADGFGIFEPGSYGLFEYDVNIPIVEALGLTSPPQREYQYLPDSTGFTMYDDYISQKIYENSWLNGGRVDFYSQDDPATGSFCIQWTDIGRYGDISFRFSPIHDLSYLVDEEYMLDFWTRCSTENVRIDVRFLDTDTGDPNDHPWRMGMTLDHALVDWDGTWQHVQLPLADFIELGAWDDNIWYDPPGGFDWSQVEHFQIVAEHHDLADIDFYFDHIRIVGSSEPVRLLGDVTDNGVVTAYDAASILQHTVRLFALVGEDSVAADVTGDGSISALDASYVLRYVIDEITEFPAEGGQQAKIVYAPRTVQVGETQASPDGRLRLPVLIDDIDGVVAGEITLSFSGRQEGISVSTTDLTSSYLLASNLQDGRIRMSFAGTESSAGPGAVLELVFDESDAELLSSLRLERVSLNEGMIPVRIAESAAETPNAYRLSQNYPNPFNPETTIRYDIAETGTVRLSVYALTGQHIRTLADGERPAGTYSVAWDGTDDTGRDVASGVYLCRMEAGEYSAVRKILLAR